MRDPELTTKFVDDVKLRKFLLGGRYTPKIGDLRRAFQYNGIFVAPEDRFGLTEFLPGMFLGPPTFNRLLDLIPRLKELVVSGVGLWAGPSSPPLTLNHFLKVMSDSQGLTLPTADDSLLMTGPTTREKRRSEDYVSGKIIYDYSVQSNNPFAPERVTLEYEARRIGALLDVHVISNRDRDLFKLADALMAIGNESGDWQVIRVAKEMYPSTESRHQVLIDVTGQLLQQMHFVPMGVVRYSGGKATDLNLNAAGEFDLSHQNREGELTLYGLREAMKDLIRRGSYMTKADMLFMYKEEDRSETVIRIEVFLKLPARRLDVSLLDSRVVGEGQSYMDIRRLDDFNQLERRAMSPVYEIGLLRDVWSAISPAVFGPAVGQLPM